MNFNFNIDWGLLKRLVVAIEELSANYAAVNARAIKAALADGTVDRRVGQTYYQNDKAIYEAEQKEKLRRLEEYGEST